MGRLLGLLFYALGTWGIVNARAWIYFGFCIAASLAGGLVLLVAAPGALAARNTISPDTPLWDRIILRLYWVLSFFGIYLIAGIEADSSAKPDVCFGIGMLLCLLAVCPQIAALAVNPFLESSARVQTDRQQTVVDAGVYRVVRHPVYSSVILWCISVSLVFPTPFVRLTAVVTAILIVVRTALEDVLLRENLAGYREYAERTRWRLIPFIW
jgi:protein-S-isoprenylcysteine O-methyltransferase Ste14